MSMLQEFKKFILRGNVVDLAVGVVIGSAFTAVVNAFVKDLISPLTGAVQGKHEFANNTFKLHNVTFHYGDFLSTLLTFLLIAAVVFFLVVQPINHLNEFARRGKQPEEPKTRKCPECFSEISVRASRCAFCTSKVSPSIKS